MDVTRDAGHGHAAKDKHNAYDCDPPGIERDAADSDSGTGERKILFVHSMSFRPRGECSRRIFPHDGKRTQVQTGTCR
jgi:hypothetical protein